MKRQLRSERTTSIARIGWCCLLGFFFANFVLRRWVGGAWGDALDGTAGLALGAAIGCQLLAMRARGRQLDGREAGPCG
ncbi:MAG: hypothetical protein IPJ17_12110 [Holophagales bacterium]|nr:MAG: hypothetical protein IPJ17_12110 [Holophagales bacterium]